MSTKQPNVQLCLPIGSNVCAFLRNANDEGLIQLQLNEIPEASCVIERFDDACLAKCGMAVTDQSLVVDLNKHVINGYPAYVLPMHCSDLEATLVVAWLTRRHFQTNGTAVEKNVAMKRYLKGKSSSMVRFLQSTNGYFFKSQLACGKCIRFRPRGDIVFCLEHIVLSGQNKGPTIESVVNVKD